MNNFRSSVLSGAKLGIDSPLVTAKVRKCGANKDSLTSIAVPRNETRSVNQREEARHRLVDEKVTIRHNEETVTAQLINLSAGGAMICAPISPDLWDPIDIQFDEENEVRASVRWVRDQRIGVEFAQETNIRAAASVRDSILREVLERHFPDLARPEEPVAPEPDEAEQRRREQRHALIFSGQIHFDHDSHRVRLRNISKMGALVEGSRTFPVGSEVLLDLAGAGTLFARVNWSRGDQSGLAFREPFDLARLTMAEPAVGTRRQADSGFERAFNEGKAWSRPPAR